MKKKVAIFNDALGTMALGFSKAGYDVDVIYVDEADRNSIRICEDNWGDIVRSIKSDLYIKETIKKLNVDFIAGRIFFGGVNRRGMKIEDETMMQAFHFLSEYRPKYFMFQCNRILDEGTYRCLYDRIVGLGYTIGFQKVNVRLVTGLPVNENAYFIFGSLHSDSIDLKLLKDVDTLNCSLDYLCEKQVIEDWYYQVSAKHNEKIEQNSYKAVLCWKGDHYKEVEFVSWNPLMPPLIAQGDSVRKMTHREIARLKSIPDEYSLNVKSKMWLYKNLMYCSNVQLIQQIVLALTINSEDEYFHRREVSKGKRFEEIVLSFFDKKGVGSADAIKEINTNLDFRVPTEEGFFNFDLRIYRNNYGIEDKIVAICEKINKTHTLNACNNILVIGNIIGKEIKSMVKEKFKIFIWDVENLLWMFEEFPQLKSDFISLLSFSVSDIIPQKPERYIFEQTSKKLDKIDLQERLRKIEPGNNDAHKYERLCAEIMRYLFSENLEFFEEQRKSNDGLYRFDYCGKIKHGNSNEFFDTVQKFFGTKYIIFEFKNYLEEITQKEIYTTEKYLYEKALRKVAIIVSRKGTDENAKRATRGSLRENGKLIICLSDDNINKLIDMKNNKEEPGDFLEALLDDMLMDLEK